MNAVVLHALDNVPVVEPFTEPVPEQDEVVVNLQAAALKPVDRQIADGSHYASPRALPVVCGTDGVGLFEDGTRIFFGGPRTPYGSMAQRTVVSRRRCLPFRPDIDDVTVAALINPALSAWLTLTWRAKMLAGESVLVLGATGVTGKLAVQIAKLLGAARVVAAGRNEQVLDTLHNFGADATIPIDSPDDELRASFVREGGNTGFNIIVDFLWGHPTEVLLESLTRGEFVAVDSETRIVQVGESAGSTLRVPAAVLRSRPVTILGTAGVPPSEILVSTFQQVIERAAHGELRIDVERVPLREVANVWRNNGHGRRLVLIP